MVKRVNIVGEAPRRGRPTQAEAERRGRALLATALDLFTVQGLAVSMEAIAAAAGISKRTLYARYPDKMALFVAVLESLSAERTAAALVLPAAMPLEDALLRYAEVLFDHYATPRIVAFLRLLQKEKERVPDLERVMREEVLRDQILPLVRYLDAQPAGTLGDFDRLVAARLHARNVIGEITDAYAEGRALDFAAALPALRESVAILSAGLRRVSRRQTAGESR
jgi:AcrR family transcriptional regulator